MNPLLSLRRLSRTVTVNGESKAIVDDISFDFEAGRIYNVLGPSGAGKSSLLRLINRLDEPTSGEVVFMDKMQCEYSPCDLRRQIGYLFQTPHLFSSTVEDNLRFARDDLSEQQLSDLLDQTRLGREMLNASVDNLSVGEKQRIALARLLATDPTIALLDEPTSALDPARTLGIEELIRELASVRGLTVIMVTHSPDQALRMGGEALLLSKGKLAEHGSAEQVVNNPQSEAGRRYVNGENE